MTAHEATCCGWTANFEQLQSSAQNEQRAGQLRLDRGRYNCQARINGTVELRLDREF